MSGKFTLLIGLVFLLLIPACTVAMDDGALAANRKAALSEDEYQSFLTNSGLVGPDISLSAGDLACVEAVLFKDAGLVNRAVNVASPRDVDGSDMAATMIAVLDCAPEALESSFSLGGSGGSPDEFGDCMIRWLGPSNDSRLQAAAGVLQQGRGEPVPRENIEPMLDLLDACIPPDLIREIFEGVYKADPAMSAALDGDCVALLLEGPARRPFLTSIFVDSGPIIESDATAAIVECWDYGLFHASRVSDAIGQDLSADTVSCFSNIAEAFNTLELLRNPRGLEQFDDEAESCYTPAERELVSELGS